ncbi:hypothetical protein HY488_00645 [Candidatus Woesearchaeota archaeon]|nr:hypothetical protein [Candidatus Woesearchaeota archaeon]
MPEQHPARKTHFQESMYFKEQHEYFLDLFSLEKDAFTVGGSGGNIFEEGTIKDFKLKAFGFLVFLFFMKFLLDIQLPAWFEIIALGIVCYLLVEVVIRIVNGYNAQSKKSAFFGMFKYTTLLIAVIMVISYVG